MSKKNVNSATNIKQTKKEESKEVQNVASSKS